MTSLNELLAEIEARVSAATPGSLCIDGDGPAWRAGFHRDRDMPHPTMRDLFPVSDWGRSERPGDRLFS